MVAVKKRLAVVALLLVAISGLSSSQFEGWPVPQGGSSTGDSIDFGDVAVSQTATARYTFKVLETSQTSVRVTFHDPCSPFGFSGLSSRSMTLAPGQSVTFNVTFTPPKAQTYTCSFVVHAAGGYPVRETETVVRLSGRGVTSAEGPSETPGSVVPGLPIDLPLTDESPDGISGTTDSGGKFEVTASPTTTVTGKLTECDGPPLGDREFRIAPVGDGYEITAPGYEVVAAEPVESISFMGMESIDLGEICLEPAPEEIVEPPTDLETEEPGSCPCCSIIVEARMCCRPTYEYVETDTVYEPQLARIRVAYCEPPEELGDVDLTPLPLTNSGGVLVNPGLAPSGPSMPDPSQVGVTSIALNGESLFEGDGEFEKTVQAGSLKPGTYTVHATIGRFDGEECVCEKTFEVVACPEVKAKLERTLDPENGCESVHVTYNLDWPKGMADICELFLDYADTHYLDRQDSLSFTDTVKPLDACDPRHVEPKILVDTRNCCSYEFAAEPFDVIPPFRMTEDCICLRLVPNADGTIAAQLVFKWKSPTSDPPGCILCENYDLLVTWGDGEISDRSDVVGLSPSQPNEYTITHQYETNPEWDDQRPPVDIHVMLSNPCGPLEKKLTGRCELPTDLITEAELDHFQSLEGSITGPDDVYVLVNNLIGIFNKVGKSQGGTTVCSVFLDIALKGLDMGDYSDFDALVKMFSKDLAGDVFGGKHDGKVEDDESWRFYPSSKPPNDKDYGSAKLVYRPDKPGDHPYFGLTILRGGCDDCPVPPTYRIVSTLTERQEKRETDETKYGTKDPSKESRPTFSSQTFSVLLSIGLCCPPDMCEE